MKARQSEKPDTGTPTPTPPPQPPPRPSGPTQPPRHTGQVVEPLDPDSEHGKAIASKLSRTLAVIERELAEASGLGRAA